MPTPSPINVNRGMVPSQRSRKYPPIVAPAMAHHECDANGREPAERLPWRRFIGQITAPVTGCTSCE
jgi:hypothetical protein